MGNRSNLAAIGIAVALLLEVMSFSAVSQDDFDTGVSTGRVTVYTAPSSVDYPSRNNAVARRESYDTSSSDRPGSNHSSSEDGVSVEGAPLDAQAEERVFRGPDSSPLESQSLLLSSPRAPYFFRAEGGAMLRTPAQSVLFQTVTPIYATSATTAEIGYTTPILSMSNLRYDFGAAGNFLMGKTLTDNISIEGGFAGALKATSRASAWDSTPNKFYTNLGGDKHVPGNMFSPFSGFGGGYEFGIAGLDYNKYAEISYTSSFRTAELNLRRQMPFPPEVLTMSILFGLRYAGVPEEFFYGTVSDITASEEYVVNGAVNEITVKTKNEMVGPQVGALMEFYAEDRWWFNCELKTALMNNSCKETSYYRNINDGVTRDFQSSDSANHTSFLADLSVTSYYRWTPHLTTRLGYRAFWLTNLALAPNNFSANVNSYLYENTMLSNRATIVYHGPFAGLEYNW